MIGRRGFLAGILGAAVAPAFVPAKILMPVRKIIVPEPMGILTPHEHRKRQAALNAARAVMLSAMVMRDGQLVEVAHSFAVPADLSPGDELRALQLLPGDQVLQTVLMEQMTTGTGWLRVSTRELPRKGRP